VTSIIANDNPLTVTDEAPLSAEFAKTFESAAPSKENMPVPVPTELPTVTDMSDASVLGDIKQATVVAELQELVAHCDSMAEAEAVRSNQVKLRPLTVIEAWPLDGVFLTTRDTRGASNESTEKPVPDTAPTVSCTVAAAIAVLGATSATTEVMDDHVQVLNASASARDEAVGSAIPKFSPETVRDEPPEPTAFRTP
jgi:hypothetical protein